MKIKIKLCRNRKNALPGGRGDELDVLDVDREELAMGQKHEKEHTLSKEIAREIALDHLAEDPNYYSNLKKAGIDEAWEPQRFSKASDRSRQKAIRRKWPSKFEENIHHLTTSGKAKELAFRLINAGVSTHEQFSNLFEPIKCLHSNRIMKFLGAGLGGSAFLMDNGHVLKIVYDCSDVESDLYNELGNAAWNENEASSLGHLMVYDHGKLSELVEYHDMCYVEMSRLETGTGKNDKNTQDVGDITEIIFKLNSYDMFQSSTTYKEALDMIKDEIKRVYQNMAGKRDRLIKHPDLKSIFASFWDMKHSKTNKKYNVGLDFHSGNIARGRTGRHVFFDPFFLEQ